MKVIQTSSSEWIEHLVFLGALLRNPRSVGAIAPSSVRLARRVAQHVTSGSRVIELGPGTGVVTRELLTRTGASGTILAVDTDRTFVERLQRAWPEIDCVCASAETLPALAAERGWSGVDHIVSGLPFAVLPAATTRLIIDGVDRLLLAGGTFTTFQYAHTFRLPPAVAFRRDVTARLACEPTSQLVFRNVPPALVLSWHRPAHERGQAPLRGE
jgi:phosphatidylethanolamine/phosphatidyl-N-methylethanolamine N-methyltransferase